jgi:DNA replication protein DnaD
MRGVKGTGTPKKRKIEEGQEKTIETRVKPIGNLSKLELLRTELHKALYDIEYAVEFSEPVKLDIHKITKSLEWIAEKCSNTVTKLKSLQKE